MANLETGDTTKPELCDDSLKCQAEGENAVEVEKNQEATEGSKMPSSAQQEEVIKKKYGGLLRKKHPLISKDHEHAFFDSADWALGKQGAQKAKGPLEALQPKLQPTPHQQVPMRRSAYAPTDDNKDVEDGESGSLEDQCCPSDQDATTKEQ